MRKSAPPLPQRPPHHCGYRWPVGGWGGGEASPQQAAPSGGGKWQGSDSATVLSFFRFFG
jgi:hypothetical protein